MVETVGSVKASKPQLDACASEERERVIESFDGVEVANLQAGGLFANGGVDRIVFKDHQALKHRKAPSHVTPSLHFHKRALLVLSCFYLLSLQLLQPRVKARFRANPHANWQRVDKQPHDPLH